MMKKFMHSVDPHIEEDFTQTQLVVFFVVLLLALDSINPIKIFLHVFPSVAPWHVVVVTLLLILYVFITEMKQLLYFSVKIFFNSILSIFFRHVEIIGIQNIPVSGPVIFTSNHANQFIDSVVLLSTCQRKISYLIAESSWKRRIVGDVAWAMGALPVKRAQDTAVKGTGKVLLDIFNKADACENTNETDKLLHLRCYIQGINTNFMSELKCGDKIRLDKSAAELKVLTIESSESMQIDISNLPKSFIALSSPIEFDIMPRIDQKIVYETILAKLERGGAIGIFPEGGSHDRTDLLPLKVGVSLIAYSALEKNGLVIPIVSVGLNYFRRHRFRGRVIVEFGRPTYVNPGSLAEYQMGGPQRRKVCNELLSRIEDNMRGVIVSAPDYETLELIHTVRRLYKNKMMTSSEKQDLSRRFAEGYKKLFFMSKGNPPKE